jgi:hypothetical protein
MALSDDAGRAWDSEMRDRKKALLDEGGAARMIDCMETRLRHSPNVSADFDMSDRELADDVWHDKLVATVDGVTFLYDHTVDGQCGDDALWVVGSCPTCGRRVVLGRALSMAAVGKAMRHATPVRHNCPGRAAA